MAAVNVRSRAATVRRLERASGGLATAAVQRMEGYGWFTRMSADDRAWVGLVAQAGIAAFVTWYRRPDDGHTITADVFGSAPPELVRAVSLHQTVELVRATIDVVEERVDDLAAPGDLADLREGILRYSREIAFAAAAVYARAAEQRGAWDARLEALTMEALLRGDEGDEVTARVSALGWTTTRGVVVVVGAAPSDEAEAAGDALRQAARARRLDALAGVHGDLLVAVLGGGHDPIVDAASVSAHFGPGPVVVGPAVPDLGQAARSADEAQRAYRVAAMWPQAPRPVSSDSLLPERALHGEPDARARLVAETHGVLAAHDPALLDTVETFLERAGSIESAARALFVHPNTVRYRLRKVTDLTGRAATEPRDAFALRLGLTLGRLPGAEAAAGQPL
jgi:hypothetical protein